MSLWKKNPKKVATMSDLSWLQTQMTKVMAIYMAVWHPLAYRGSGGDIVKKRGSGGDTILAFTNNNSGKKKTNINHRKE